MEHKPVIYFIRKQGRIYQQSEETNCGHSKDTLRTMEEAGYYLFKNEKQITGIRR